MSVISRQQACHVEVCLLSAVNKPVMLKCGLIDGVLPHLKVDLAAVQFKLLGTLRMIIDGQGELIGWFFKPCLFVSGFLLIVLFKIDLISYTYYGNL